MSDEKQVNKKSGSQVYNKNHSINPKDNLALPKNKLTFDQMLDNAIKNDRGNGSNSARGGNIKSGSQVFLKKKDRYDPRKSISN